MDRLPTTVWAYNTVIKAGPDSSENCDTDGLDLASGTRLGRCPGIRRRLRMTRIQQDETLLGTILGKAVAVSDPSCLVDKLNLNCDHKWHDSCMTDSISIV